jgi:hypothetical protein
MFTKTAFALTLVLVTSSAALAAAKTHSATETLPNVYNPAGAYVGTDPDPNVRFELRRDWDRGH